MKKAILFVVMCFMLALSGTLFAACGDTGEDPVKLGAPELTAEGTTVTWSAVEHATGYQVRVGEGAWSASQTSTSYTLEETAAGTYTVYVKAVSSAEGYTESDAASISVTVQQKLATPALTAEENVVSWQAVAGASGYQVRIGTGTWGETQTATTYTLNETEAGSYTIFVKAVSSDANVLESAAASITVVITETLAKPVLNLEDKVISWAAVENASGYQIRIDDGEWSAVQTETSYTFTEEQPGTYQIYVKAVSDDPVYEESEPAQTEITVTDEVAPVIEVANKKIVGTPNATVSLTAAALGITLSDNVTADNEIVFSVTKVLHNGATEVDIASGSFTAESGYYQIFVEAKDGTGNPATTDLVYITSEAIRMFTFDESEGPSNSIYWYSQVDLQPVAAEGILSFNLLSDNPLIRLIDDDGGVSTLAGFEAGDPVTISMRVNVSQDFNLAILDENARETVAPISSYGAKPGEWSTVTFKTVIVTTAQGYNPTTPIGDANNNIMLFGIPVSGSIIGATLQIDNVTVVDAGAPAISATETSRYYPETGGTLDLAPGEFGITASDNVDGALTPVLTSVTFNSEPVSDFGTSLVLAKGTYVLTYTATDAAGNASTVLITINCASDSSAPVIAFADSYTVNRSVAAGTQITLSEAGLGITVTDDNEYSLSYEVKCNGAVTEAEDSITVSAGQYYEIVVTATDSSENMSRQYILIYAEDIQVVSFDTITDNTALEALNYVCNAVGDATTVNATRKLVDENGNKSFSFTTGEPPRHMAFNWVAPGLTAGKYNIRINFRFTGDITFFHLTDSTENPLNGQQLTDDGYITLENWEVAAAQYHGATLVREPSFAFEMMAYVTGDILVDSIVFTPVA